VPTPVVASGTQRRPQTGLRRASSQTTGVRTIALPRTPGANPSVPWQPAQPPPPVSLAYPEAGSLAPTSPAAVGTSVVKVVRSEIGKPYRFGATGPSAFDCSGLVQFAYKRAGVEIPRTTWTQFADKNAIKVPLTKLRPGDALYFDTTGKPRDASHTGVYIGNNKMIVAPHTGANVKIEPLTGYWKGVLLGARRWTPAGRAPSR
jgi:murein DD-endopeptidase